MLSKHSGESPGGIHAVEHPERVAQLVAQFWRGERVLLLRGQSIEETLHVVVMDEPSVLRLEELVPDRTRIRSERRRSACPAPPRPR